MNKYAEYKDSGIDWIGEIPSKWNVLQFKNTIDNIKNGTSTTQETAETSYLVTRIETISTGEINFDKVGYVCMNALQHSNYKINRTGFCPVRLIFRIQFVLTLGSQVVFTTTRILIGRFVLYRMERLLC